MPQQPFGGGQGAHASFGYGPGALTAQVKEALEKAFPPLPDGRTVNVYALSDLPGLLHSTDVAVLRTAVTLDALARRLVDRRQSFAELVNVPANVLDERLGELVAGTAVSLDEARDAVAELQRRGSGAIYRKDPASDAFETMVRFLQAATGADSGRSARLASCIGFARNPAALLSLAVNSQQRGPVQPGVSTPANPPHPQQRAVMMPQGTPPRPQHPPPIMPPGTSPRPPSFPTSLRSDVQVWPVIPPKPQQPPASARAASASSSPAGPQPDPKADVMAVPGAPDYTYLNMAFLLDNVKPKISSNQALEIGSIVDRKIDRQVFTDVIVLMQVARRLPPEHARLLSHARAADGSPDVVEWTARMTGISSSQIEKTFQQLRAANPVNGGGGPIGAVDNRALILAYMHAVNSVSLRDPGPEGKPQADQFIEFLAGVKNLEALLPMATHVHREAAQPGGKEPEQKPNAGDSPNPR